MHDYGQQGANIGKFKGVNLYLVKMNVFEVPTLKFEVYRYRYFDVWQFEKV